VEEREGIEREEEDGIEDCVEKEADREEEEEEDKEEEEEELSLKVCVRSMKEREFGEIECCMDREEGLDRWGLNWEGLEWTSDRETVESEGVDREGEERERISFIIDCSLISFSISALNWGDNEFNSKFNSLLMFCSILPILSILGSILTSGCPDKEDEEELIISER
jgi:hypothetical protein